MNLRSQLLVIRNSLSSGMEYRTDYMLLILSGFISFAMENSVLSSIYQGRSEVGGLPVDKVFSFVMLGILVRSGGILWSHVSDAVSAIRDGSFRKFLLQPIKYSKYFMATAIGPKIPTWVICLICLPLFNVIPWIQIPVFLFTVTLCYALLWQIYLCIVYLGFWIEEAQFLNVTLNIALGLFSGSILPLSWMPDWLHNGLRYTPLPLLGDFPVRASLNLLGPHEIPMYLTLFVSWFGGLYIFNTLLFRFGTKQFEAFGG